MIVMMDYDNPFHDVRPVNVVGGGLEERLCYALNLNEETYTFREDFEDETTRVS